MEYLEFAEYIYNIYRNEYSIIPPSIEKTGRKPCCIREQIIGIAMVLEHEFDNLICIWLDLLQIQESLLFVAPTWPLQ